MSRIVAFFSLILALNGIVCQDELKNTYPKYKFSYNTGDEGGHFRKEESNAEGHVTGMYQYVDPNGNLRIIRYKSEPDVGYQAFGDVGVYPKTHVTHTHTQSSSPGNKFNMYYLRPSASKSRTNEAITERKMEEVKQFVKTVEANQKRTTLSKEELDNHLTKDIFPTQSSFLSTLGVEDALPTTEGVSPVTVAKLPEESTSNAETEATRLPPFDETRESSNKIENLAQLQSQKSIQLHGTDSPQVHEISDKSLFENNSVTDLRLTSPNRLPFIFPLRFNSEPKFLPFFYVYPNSVAQNAFSHTYPLVLK